MENYPLLGRWLDRLTGERLKRSNGLVNDVDSIEKRSIGNRPTKFMTSTVIEIVQWSGGSSLSGALAVSRRDDRDDRTRPTQKA